MNNDDIYFDKLNILFFQTSDTLNFIDRKGRNWRDIRNVFKVKRYLNGKYSEHAQ